MESTGGEATKRMLAGSLKGLMAQKPLNKISIREITEGCGVNRQTFYYHFEDIYDLVQWMYRQEAISLLAEREGMLVWQDGLLQLFRYLEENREVCLCTLDSLGHNYLRRFFYGDIHDILHRTIETLAQDLDDKDRKNFATDFYVAALAGLVENWLRGYLTQTPEELVKLVDAILQDHYAGARLRQKGAVDSIN